MSKSLLKKEFPVKDRGLNETLGRFLDVSDTYIWFWIEVNTFQTGRSAQSHSWLCAFKQQWRVEWKHQVLKEHGTGSQVTSDYKFKSPFDFQS